MEMLFQYLWKFGLLPEGFATTDGRPVEVLYPGVHNRDAGPDFLGARVRIGGDEWAGNVEVHVKASDWYRHHHDTDPAYDNVILHLVAVADAKVTDRSGNPFPQAILTFPESFTRMYMMLAGKISDLPCRAMLRDISPMIEADWRGALAVERMQQKAQRISDLLSEFSGDWERACFVTLARALGFGLNSQPFEMLARSIPFSSLFHHSDNLFQLEALLFGQAGMLDTSVNIFDEYYQQLCREYIFLARKYGLRPMRADLWKYARTRPQNFPHRRVALLAAVTEGGCTLFSDLLENVSDADALRSLFGWRLRGYWAEHSGFGCDAGASPVALSKGSIDLLIINFAAPVVYAYGAAIGDPDLAEQGLNLWESLAAERNSIIAQWKAAGLKCDNAMDSQAYLQLKKEYCDRNRCLQCRFGHHLLRQAIVRH